MRPGEEPRRRVRGRSRDSPGGGAASTRSGAELGGLLDATRQGQLPRLAIIARGPDPVTVPGAIPARGGVGVDGTVTGGGAVRACRRRSPLPLGLFLIA